MKKVLVFCRRNLAWTLLLLAVLFFSLTSNNFLTSRNLLNILNQNCYVLIAAFGISFIMMSGGMDLSIGYLMSITGVLSAKMITEACWPVPVVIIATIAIAMVLCTLNAVLSQLLNIPRIFITFGTMTIYQGLSYVISQSKTIGITNVTYKFMGQGMLFGINFSFALLLTILLGLVVSFILNKTYFGRYVFALGGNPDAARLAGINVKKMEIYISLLAGFFLGVASLVLCARVGSAAATTAVGTEFTVITGLLLGGVSIRGGEGKINGCVAGILLIALLGNGMQMSGMNIYYQYVAKGFIMLATIGFDTFQMNRKKLEENTRKDAPQARNG